MRLDLYHHLPTAELAEARRFTDALERIAAALENLGGPSAEEEAQIQGVVAQLKASSDRLEQAIAATRPPPTP
jgi:hypothetical protein